MITIAEIQRRAAEYYGLRLTDMKSERRPRRVARPRQVAMALAYELCGRSLTVIGREFGGRDHSTVWHAVRQVDALSAADGSFAADVATLRSKLAPAVTHDG